MLDLFESFLFCGLLCNFSYILIFLRCIYNHPLSDIFNVIVNSYPVINWWLGWIGQLIISTSFMTVGCGCLCSKEPSTWIFMGGVILGYGGSILLIASLL